MADNFHDKSLHKQSKSLPLKASNSTSKAKCKVCSTKLKDMVGQLKKEKVCCSVLK